MKTELEQRAMELTRRLQRFYFEVRDIPVVTAMLEPEAVWVGLSGGDIARNSGDDVVNSLESPLGYEIVDMPLVADALGDGLCMVSGTTTLRERGGGPETAVRITALCRESGGKLRFRQVHLSVPGAMRSVAQPDQPTRQRESMLSHLLDRQSAKLAERDQRLAAITRNLPGGVVCCDNSPDLNLIEFSDGFLELYGYTREEVHTLFHDRFCEMIVAEDLAAAWPQVNEQLSRGNTKEIEYRIRRKDGSLIWVMDRGQLVLREDGTGCFYCILIDVTEAKTTREVLQSTLERYQIILDQTNDIVFQWNLDTDALDVSGNWEKTFGYPPLEEGKMEDVFRPRSSVHPEDRGALRQLVDKVRGNQPYGEAEMRLADAGGRFLWCRMRITLQRTESGRQAVGVIINIDAEKRRSQKLLQLAQRDTLTGLYNKGTAQRMIEEAMSGGTEERAALMILDLDDFKLVNDKYGHLGGDAVLSDVAVALQGIFRREDVIGRIGGDEFCVFLSGFVGDDLLQRKADQVLEFFRAVGAEVSCSIGIAIAPLHGRDYTTLFQHADMALYHAKEKGKNRWAVYEESMIFPELDGRGDGRERIESDRQGAFLGSALAGYVFQALYEAGDVEQALPPILEIVGRQFDVSRMYIYELEEDDRFVSNTFEWCNDGITSEIGSLQHIPCEGIGDILDPLRDQGVLYCRDVSQMEGTSRAVLEAQGIRSTLQCAIYDGREFRGAVGFDECSQLRMWTQEQVDVLSFLANVVSTFLMKHRAEDRSRDLMGSLRSILDRQQTWIFVVDPEDRSILYANQKTTDVVPGLRLGDRCYERFYGRSTPCTDCPAACPDARGEAVARLHSVVLDREVDARMEPIVWAGGRKAWLITCTPADEEI